MPNSCYNTIKITEATPETIEQIKQDLNSNERAIDFNNIIPMPPDSDTFCAKKPLGDEELKKYGKNNWFDWSCENWGTKWNCWDSSYNGNGVWECTTAYAPPIPIIDKIARKYHCVVTCEYYIELMNSGKYVSYFGENNELEEYDEAIDADEPCEDADAAAEEAMKNKALSSFLDYDN